VTIPPYVSVAGSTLVDSIRSESRPFTAVEHEEALNISLEVCICRVVSKWL